MLGYCSDDFFPGRVWYDSFVMDFFSQKKTSTFSIFQFLNTKLNIRENITINIESISRCFFNPDASTFDFESFRARFSKTLGRGLEISFRGKSGVPHERREEDTKNGVRFAFLKYEVDGL